MANNKHIWNIYGFFEIMLKGLKNFIVEMIFGRCKESKTDRSDVFHPTINHL